MTLHCGLRSISVLLVSLICGGLPAPLAPADAPAATSPAVSPPAASPPAEHAVAREQLDEVLRDPLFRRWEKRRLRRTDELSDSLASDRLSAYADSVSSRVKDFFDWIFRSRRSSAPPAGSAGPSLGGDLSALVVLARTLGWIALAVLIAATLWVLLAVTRQRGPRRSRNAAPDRETLDTALDGGDALAAASNVWSSHAQQLVDEGDLRAAFRAVYLALLSGLHAAGRIRFRAQRTNYFYVEGFRGPPEDRARFARVTETFDDVWYGQQPPDGPGLAALQRQTETLLAVAPHPETPA